MKNILLSASIAFFFISWNSKNISAQPEVMEIEKKFTKSIERIYNNDFERDLIFKAESVNPNRDSVLKYMSDDIPQSSIPDSNLWFCNIFDGVLIPFAITSVAISYYDNLIDSLSFNNGFNFFITANFEYKAVIEFKETYTFEGNNLLTQQPLPSVTFEQVYVVTMDLKWGDYCGTECGLWFYHKRIIVFDESGNLLNVFYDGTIPLLVS